MSGLLVNQYRFAPPFNPNTKLLMHFDGADGGTTFIDSSQYNHAVINNKGFNIYDAITSAAQVKFGVSALKNGNESFLEISSSNDFDVSGNVPFTIEGWIYGTPSGDILSMRKTGTYCPFELLGDGRVFIGNAASNNWASTSLTSGSSFAAGTWNHFALVGNGTAIKYYINGLGGVTTPHISWYSQARAIYIGRGGNSFNGNYMDELRIIIGEAVYTGNFTPPAAPFTS